MRVLASWHVPVAVAVGALLAVGGSKLMERLSPPEVSVRDDIVRAPTTAIVVPRITIPRKGIAAKRAYRRIPRLLERPSDERRWPPPKW